MPGRTPAEAFAAFMGPLKGAISCLGQVSCTTSPGGTTKPDVEHSWVLNRGLGVATVGWHFDAGMKYEIIRTPDGLWRVTTLAYRYRLAYVGEDLWRLHWHPGGASDVVFPHLHARFDGTPGGANTIREHLPMQRATLEDAIRWAQAVGFPMVRPDWAAVLRMTEADHLRYRSWSTTPDE